MRISVLLRLAMTRGEGEPVTTWSCQRYSVLVMDAYSCDGCRQVGAGWMHYLALDKILLTGIALRAGIRCKTCR